MELTKNQTDQMKRYIVVGLFWLNIVIMTLVWWHNFGLHRIATAAILTAIGHITGLWCAFLILCVLVLMSRIWILEDAYGMEKLTRIHRKVSYWSIYLLIAHVIFITIGYELSLGMSFIDMFIKFISIFENLLEADIGFVLFLLVIVTSIVLVRKKLRYETWYFVHLLAYLAVLLGFFHQLSVGVDFVGHPLFVVYWYALYILTIASLIIFRIGWQLLIFYQHRFRLVEVKSETHNTHTFTLEGKNLTKFRYEPGQFAIWHILTPKLWWQSHPFSFSSVPNAQNVRFTTKASGDFTRELAESKPGPWVIVDGPHGKFTPRQRHNEKLLLIAGGVGITPLYAMLCELAPEHKDIILFYAARTPKDVIFKEEIESLQKSYGFQLHYFFSAEPDAPQKRITGAALKQFAPDAPDRSIFLCGPIPMMDAMTKLLQSQGVKKSHIHTERFDY